tara:strand:- start:21688 stop:23316 length:1629 start_codon:yes stop_codon:yes gene_type:complete
MALSAYAYPSFVSGGSPQQQVTTSAVVPAPVLGVQSNKSLYEMDPRECIYAYNIIPREYAMEVRKGYYLFATIDDEAEIRTVMEFPDGANSKIFAATTEGIYDITAGGTISAATFAYEWTTSGPESGYCSYVFFTNSSGMHLLVCDETNGYVRFDGTDWTVGGMTADPAGVNGPIGGDDNLVHVCEFKERLWFTEQNTGRAWYTAPGSLSGTSTPFEFGRKFTHGGYLRALYNWTIDGGNGVDDYLLAVGDSGDLLVYKGTDPSDVASFSQIGNWYVGDLPAGRRVGSNFGGEFVLLCAGGLVSITKLLRGADIGENTAYLTYNIARLIRNTLASYSALKGWDITLFPEDNLLIVSSPESVSNLQFVMNISTKAWGMTRNVPTLSSMVYDGNLYIGDRSGSIHIQSGSTDGADVNGADGDDIEWSFLSSYQSLGSPGANKRMQLVRPLFLSSGAPSYDVQARYDFDLSAVIGGSLTTPTYEASLWDEGVWDEATWGGGAIVSYGVLGTKGMGRHLALAVVGRSAAATEYGGADVLWDVGGLL